MKQQTKKPKEVYNISFTDSKTKQYTSINIIARGDIKALKKFYKTNHNTKVEGFVCKGKKKDVYR